MARKLKNWLLAYRDYTEQTESPEMFHIWCGLSALSASTQRKVYIDRSYFQIYPNLYVVIVSPPGSCRKSSAMSYARSLLDQVPEINIESNKMTPQALIKSLSSQPLKQATTKTTAKSQKGVQLKKVCATILWSSEFSVTLGSDANQTGMLSLLTDLFDCPNSWKYETLSRGREVLSNVFLGILGATTPDWLSTSIPTDAIGGGFTSRIIFVSQSRRRRNNPWPKMSPKLLALRDALVHDLLEIAQLEGPMKITKEAEEFYDHWYNALDPHYMDERFWGYVERKPVHLLKVAMLISLSFSNSMLIKVSYLEMALELLARVEARMPEAFKGAGTSISRDVERVLGQIIDAKGQTTFAKLMHQNIRTLSQHQLNEIISALERANIISITLPAGSITLIDEKHLKQTKLDQEEG